MNTELKNKLAVGDRVYNRGKRGQMRTPKRVVRLTATQAVLENDIRLKKELLFDRDNNTLKSKSVGLDGDYYYLFDDLSEAEYKKQLKKEKVIDWINQLYAMPILQKIEIYDLVMKHHQPTTTTK